MQPGKMQRLLEQFGDHGETTSIGAVTAVTEESFAPSQRVFACLAILLSLASKWSLMDTGRRSRKCARKRVSSLLATNRENC